jgi:hypothetical protein
VAECQGKLHTNEQK